MQARREVSRPPCVSVVVATRNRRPLLARSLRSILAQEGVDLELIVVDDGSEDSTGRFLADLDDDRLRVVTHEEPRGVTTARNAGIERARGAWIAFIDDDDLWAPGKLLAQLRALEKTPSARWACTGAVLVDRDLRVLGPQEPPRQTDVTALLLGRNAIPGGASGVLAATDLVRDVGGFDPALSRLADWDLWIRLALRSPCASARQVLVAYVVAPGGMAHDVVGSMRELEWIEDKYRSERSARGVDIDWAFWLWYFGQLHLRAGRRLAAARCHVRLAWSYGDHRRWLLAGVGLLWPGVQGVRDGASGRRMPPDWHRQVQEWLEPARSSNGIQCLHRP